MAGRGRTALRSTGMWLRGRFSVPHPNPVIILGNQKSGTSAIAALLAAATESSLTLDFRRLIQEPDLQADLRGQRTDFDRFIRRYRLEFSRQVIKEPALTFFADELRSAFPAGQMVFIVRDPRDNIRSILNRLDIPGNLEDESEMTRLAESKSVAWQMILQSRWLGVQATNYVAALAYRWALAVDEYLRCSHYTTLVRYEDFKETKVGTISTLAARLGMDVTLDISSIANMQYQRKGRNDRTWRSFFGDNNLALIEHICADGMQVLSYDRRSG